MRTKERIDRAYGPEKHGKRWRIHVIGADGARDRRSFESEEEALAFKAAFRVAAGTRTVDDAVLAFVDEQSDRPSHETTRYRLYGLLRLPGSNRPMAALTSAIARQLATKRASEVTATTLHGELSYASRWAKWCVERGWLESNPFDGIKASGNRSVGKPQLRVDEARQLLAILAADESPEATAVLMALLLGLRAHEIVERTVRDLDDGGRLLHVSKSKTRAGVRQLAIPFELQSRLATLVAGRAPDARIFGEMSRYALHYHVVRFAALARVPRVTPHGLRGTFATMLAASHVSAADIATIIGHADRGTTARRHYMAPGVEQSAGAERVTAMLATAPRDPSQAN